MKKIWKMVLHPWKEFPADGEKVALTVKDPGRTWTRLLLPAMRSWAPSHLEVAQLLLLLLVVLLLQLLLLPSRRARREEDDDMGFGLSD